MKNFNLENPDAVFLYAPQIQDICIEFGIDKSDAETITCMYEVFKRVNTEGNLYWDQDAYDEGYKEGWNEAIEETQRAIDDLSWEVERLKKN